MHALVILVVALITSTQTPHELTGRAEAHHLLKTLNTQQVDKCCREELQSARQAFGVAEEFLRQEEIDSADIYFKLALIKGRLLEEKLGNLQENPPEPVAADNAGADATLYGPHPLPDAPTAQETAARIAARRQAKPPLKPRGMIVGGEQEYEVKPADTLRLVGAKLGISWRHLAKINKLEPTSMLKIGQKLKVVNRKIVPKKINSGIVINIPDKTLYFFKDGQLARTIPVALGKGKDKESENDWSTPTGYFKIVKKEKDPTWRVPPSIQKEMEDSGKDVITEIPPGKENPLGKYAMKTSIPGILIHSTIRPTSINTFSSHGCIRVYPEHMEQFFGEVEVNTRGEIIYKPVKLAVSQEGRIFLEVARDIYEKFPDPEKEIRDFVKKIKGEDHIDWKKVELLLKHKTGIAEDVSL